jgi:hypothetical protein
VDKDARGLLSNSASSGGSYGQAELEGGVFTQMKKTKRDYDVYNETSNTMAGINTPTEQEDMTSTNLISEIVEKTMDNIQKDLVGKDPK